MGLRIVVNQQPIAELMIEASKVSGTSIAVVKKSLLKESSHWYLNSLAKFCFQDQRRWLLPLVLIYFDRISEQVWVDEFPYSDIKHIKKVIHEKERRHRMLYGYLYNKFYNHFWIIYTKGIPRIVKKNSV